MVWPLGRRGINIISECARPKILFGWVANDDGCGYARDISGTYTHSPVQSLSSGSLGSELLSLGTQAQLRDRAPLFLVAVEHHHIGPTYSLANHHPAHTQCPCPCVLVCYCCCCYLSRVARVACSLTRSNRRYVECERICKFVQNKFCLYGPKTLFASSARRPFSLIAATRHIIEWSVVPLPLPRVSCRPFSDPCHQKALTRSFGNSHLAIIPRYATRVRVRLLAENRARNMDCIQMNLRRGECK